MIGEIIDGELVSDAEAVAGARACVRPCWEANSPLPTLQDEGAAPGGWVILFETEVLFPGRGRTPGSGLPRLEESAVPTGEGAQLDRRRAGLVCEVLSPGNRQARPVS